MTRNKLTEIYIKIFTKMGEEEDISYNQDGLIADSFMIVGNANICFEDIFNLCEAVGMDNIEIANYDELYIKKIDLPVLKRCNIPVPDEIDFIPGRGLRLWWD